MREKSHVTFETTFRLIRCNGSDLIPPFLLPDPEAKTDKEVVWPLFKRCAAHRRTMPDSLSLHRPFRRPLPLITFVLTLAPFVHAQTATNSVQPAQDPGIRSGSPAAGGPIA